MANSSLVKNRLFDFLAAAEMLRGGGGGRERQRQRQRDRQTDRQTDRQREREREPDRQTNRDRVKARPRAPTRKTLDHRRNNYVKAVGTSPLRSN